MTPVTAAKVKYGVWGLIGGAIIAMIIGFAWGGWTTHMRQDKHRFPLITCRYAAIGSPTCLLALQR
jgi:O-antigen/teichoic acid export membrane protein